ncbi:hypothetical protein L1049_022593 [Liquidambar formosana]|uniref:Uncharacterized protein n=1 Tax=Liquidambar formosana TaxID=63359 RepID=A0AAP0RCN7_LIQFO
MAQLDQNLCIEEKQNNEKNGKTSISLEREGKKREKEEMSSNVVQPNPPLHNTHIHTYTHPRGWKKEEKSCCHKYPSATSQKNPHLHHCLSLKKNLYFFTFFPLPDLCGLFGTLCLGQSFHRENRKARTFSITPSPLSISSFSPHPLFLYLHYFLPISLS